MNLLTTLTTIGFSPSSAFVEFVHSYQAPRETAVPGLGSRLPLESPDGQAALANVVQHAAPQLLELAEAIRGIVATNELGLDRAAAVSTAILTE